MSAILGVRVSLSALRQQLDNKDEERYPSCVYTRSIERCVVAKYCNVTHADQTDNDL